MQGFQNMPNFYQMAQPYQERLSQMQAPVHNPQVNQGLLWVSGEVGAKSYLVAPNSTVLLMDSDAQRFYLKSADNSGMPSLRIFEYSEIQNASQIAPNRQDLNLNDKYVTREEYNGLKGKYEALMDKLESIYLKSKGGNVDE